MTKTQERVLARIRSSFPHTTRKTECAPISPRAFEAAVRELRLAGYPIASDGDGYRWAVRPKDLRETADALLRRMGHVAETRDALLETGELHTLRGLGAEAPSIWDQP